MTPRPAQIGTKKIKKNPSQIEDYWRHQLEPEISFSKGNEPDCDLLGGAIMRG